MVADSGEFALRGAPAADFELRDLEGKTVRLSTFRGALACKEIPRITTNKQNIVRAFYEHL